MIYGRLLRLAWTDTSPRSDREIGLCSAAVVFAPVKYLFRPSTFRRRQFEDGAVAGNATRCGYAVEIAVHVSNQVCLRITSVLRGPAETVGDHLGPDTAPRGLRRNLEYRAEVVGAADEGCASKIALRVTKQPGFTAPYFLATGLKLTRSY